MAGERTQPNDQVALNAHICVAICVFFAHRAEPESVDLLRQPRSVCV
jgi:hypothetical protein